jgi:hypothetical protein
MLEPAYPLSRMFLPQPVQSKCPVSAATGVQPRLTTSGIFTDEVSSGAWAQVLPRPVADDLTFSNG